MTPMQWLQRHVRGYAIVMLYANADTLASNLAGQAVHPLMVLPEQGTRVLGCYRQLDRKSTRLNSSHLVISYAVFCLKKKTNTTVSPANTSLTTRTSMHGAAPRRACHSSTSCAHSAVIGLRSATITVSYRAAVHTQRR